AGAGGHRGTAAAVGGDGSARTDPDHGAAAFAAADRGGALPTAAGSVLVRRQRSARPETQAERPMGRDRNRRPRRRLALVDLPGDGGRGRSALGSRVPEAKAPVRRLYRVAIS